MPIPAMQIAMFAAMCVWSHIIFPQGGRATRIITGVCAPVAVRGGTKLLTYPERQRQKPQDKNVWFVII